MIRPPYFGLGRGPITPPNPAMVRMDRKDLNLNKTNKMKLVAGVIYADILIPLKSISCKIWNRKKCVPAWLLICGDHRECFLRFWRDVEFDFLSDIVCRCRMRNGRCGSVILLATTLLTLLVPIYTGKYIHVTCITL